MAKLWCAFFGIFLIDRECFLENLPRYVTFLFLDIMCILREPTKHLLASKVCIFSNFFGCVNMFLILFKLHICHDHLHQLHPQLFMRENHRTYCCRATTVFDYQNGTVPSLTNDPFQPSLNRYSTRSQMPLDISLRKPNTGQQALSSLGTKIWTKLAAEIKM